MAGEDTARNPKQGGEGEGKAKAAAGSCFGGQSSAPGVGAGAGWQPGEQEEREGFL